MLTGSPSHALLFFPPDPACPAPAFSMDPTDWNFFDRSFFAKAFRFEPECERVSYFINTRSTASLENSWLSLALKDWTGLFTWNFPLLSANMSLPLDDLLCQIYNLNSRLNSAFPQKCCYKMPCLLSICPLLFKTSLVVSSNEHRDEDALLTARFCLAIWIKERFYSKLLLWLLTTGNNERTSR